MKTTSIHWERIGLALATLVYLVVFNETIPDGNALRIVRQIDAGQLIWNPNHLIFDPIGYAFHRLLSGISGGQITALASFEVLSAIGAIVSVVLFHTLLIRSGVRHAAVRIAATVAFFATASVLYQAVSQYYFIIQIPFLIGALILYVDFLARLREQRPYAWNLYGMGVLLAIATTLMFNNLLLVLAAGIALGFSEPSLRKWRLEYTARMWAAAAVVGFPIFIAGYLLGDSSADFVTWLVSYEGVEDSTLNEHFGVRWTVQRVLQGIAQTGFNFALGNMVEHAGLGTFLAVLAFGYTLEFVPQWGKIVLSAIAIPLVLAFHAFIAYYVLRRFAVQPAVRVLAAWIIAFALFNFLWSAGDEIFWFQIVPATWLLMLMAQRATTQPALSGPVTESIDVWSPGSWRRYALMGFAALLLVVNTVNAVIPVSSDDFYEKQARHAALLRDGDLEIFPGWDAQRWLILPAGGPQVRRLNLLNMALAERSSAEHMAQLPSIVADHLQNGGRVIIARLYDKDEDLNPWYGLNDANWPRARIQELLGDFCRSPLENIDGVIFHELRQCKAPSE